MSIFKKAASSAQSSSFCANMSEAEWSEYFTKLRGMVQDSIDANLDTYEAVEAGLVKADETALTTGTSLLIIDRKIDLLSQTVAHLFYAVIHSRRA